MLVKGTPFGIMLTPELLTAMLLSHFTTPIASMRSALSCRNNCQVNPVET